MFNARLGLLLVVSYAIYDGLEMGFSPFEGSTRTLVCALVTENETQVLNPSKSG